MSACLAAAFTTCQIALGVIPSPQILPSRLTRRKIVPSVMAAAPIHSSTARFAQSTEFRLTSEQAYAPEKLLKTLIGAVPVECWIQS